MVCGQAHLVINGNNQYFIVNKRIDGEKVCAKKSSIFKEANILFLDRTVNPMELILNGVNMMAIDGGEPQRSGTIK